MDLQHDNSFNTCLGAKKKNPGTAGGNVILSYLEIKCQEQKPVPHYFKRFLLLILHGEIVKTSSRIKKKIPL